MSRRNLVEVSCQTCGESFSTRSDRIKIGWGKYCSHRCASKSLHPHGPSIHKSCFDSTPAVRAHGLVNMRQRRGALSPPALCQTCGLPKKLADMVEIGKDLIAIKDRLGHGNFMAWCKAEFGWNERTARRYMRVCDVFKTDNLSVLDVAPSAAIALSSPSVPDEVLAEAIERAESGEEITNAIAKEIIASHRPDAEAVQLDYRSALKLIRAAVVRIRNRLPDEALAVVPEFLRTLASQIESGEQ